MAEYPKPLPHMSPESRPFWEGARNHELLIQKCRNCGKFHFYPRSICPNCWSYDLEWVKVSGIGKIYSFTVSYRSPSSGFKPEVPYNVAMVELEEGVRLMTNIVECRNEDLKIDMPVKVVFEDVTPEITLPKFRPLAL